mgnify:CR=1
DCLISIKSGKNKRYDNFECNKNLTKELSQELYKRMYLPFYIPLISIIVCFLTLNSYSNNNYKKTKLITFLIGIVFIILSQVSINFISDKIYFNYFIFSIVPIFIIIFYYLFNLKKRNSS